MQLMHCQTICPVLTSIMDDAEEDNNESTDDSPPVGNPDTGQGDNIGDNTDNDNTEEQEPQSKTMNGIDVSNYQRGLDLSKVDIDFVIIKATEGTSLVMDTCDGFYQQAKQLGIHRGIYHFARPEYNSAEAEAAYFLKHTQGYRNDAIMALDWESPGCTDPNWALTWLNYVYNQTGVRPLIYMSDSVARNQNWTNVIAADYGLWVAKYRDYEPDYNFDMSNAGSDPTGGSWPFYAMWQWTSSGRLDGYSGNLDCNIFYGSVNAWNAYAGIK